MSAEPSVESMRTLDWLLIYAISTLVMIILFHAGWRLHNHATIPYFVAVCVFSLLSTQVCQKPRLKPIMLAAFAGTSILMLYFLLFDQITIGMTGWLYFVAMYYYGAISCAIAMALWLVVYCIVHDMNSARKK